MSPSGSTNDLNARKPKRMPPGDEKSSGTFSFVEDAEGGEFVEKESTFHFPIADVTGQNGTSHRNEDEVFCGIVLAGGEGKRLQPFIKSLGKGTLPKQYVNFIGSRSMLEHTLERAEKLIPPARVLTVITEPHLRYPEVRQQCSGRPKDTLIVQPDNMETGPGLLFPLMHLYKWYPNSLVLVLPSDHFVWQEDRLMDYARLACMAVKRDPARLILLGVKPDRDEPEYGYLLPNKKRLAIGPDMSEISWFIEKPDPKTARRLTRAGGLWNTMIMVFKTKTMLHWVSRVAPRLYQQLQQVYEAIGTPSESDVVRKIYRGLRPMNFSKEFLEPMARSYPSSLVVLPVRDLLWSDWGTASRIMDVLAKIGKVPRPEGSHRREDPERYQFVGQRPFNGGDFSNSQVVRNSRRKYATKGSKTQSLESK